MSRGDDGPRLGALSCRRDEERRAKGQVNRAAGAPASSRVAALLCGCCDRVEGPIAALRGKILSRIAACIVFHGIVFYAGLFYDLP